MCLMQPHGGNGEIHFIVLAHVREMWHKPIKNDLTGMSLSFRIPNLSEGILPKKLLSQKRLLVRLSEVFTLFDWSVQILTDRLRHVNSSLILRLIHSSGMELFEGLWVINNLSKMAVYFQGWRLFIQAWQHSCSNKRRPENSIWSFINRTNGHGIKHSLFHCIRLSYLTIIHFV